MTRQTTVSFAVLLATATALLFISGFGAAPAEAQIDTYRILLKNGNTFTSVQRPQRANFDDNLIVIRSLGGHVVALPVDQIEKVESDLEFQGFGTLINKTTILVGTTANDAEEFQVDPSAALSRGGFGATLADIVANQPFFAGTEPVQVPAVGTPVTQGFTQAPVYDIPDS